MMTKAKKKAVRSIEIAVESDKDIETGNDQDSGIRAGTESVEVTTTTPVPQMGLQRGSPASERRPSKAAGTHYNNAVRCVPALGHRIQEGS